MDGTGAETAYSGEEVKRARDAIRQKNTSNLELAAGLKVHFGRLPGRFKAQAYRDLRVPRENKDDLEKLRDELHEIFDDMRSAQQFLGAAHTIFTDRSHGELIERADALLKALLYGEYSDANMYLSAAVRIARQHQDTEPGEALQAGSDLALARAARDAATACLRFAETFEQVAKVIVQLAADVQLPGTGGGMTT